MSVSGPLSQVAISVRQYLRGELPAAQLVRTVDELVSENLLSDLEPAAANLLDKLHIALALYTPDEVTRREEPRALIGPVELLEQARMFDEQIRLLGY